MAETNILVVEDERIVARDLQRRLHRLGYTVCAIAASGPEALEHAAQTQPDLILMDIVLPGSMDGIEAAAQIRARADIPIIYLTAHADEATLQRAKTTEPFGYLLKPFDTRVVQTTIEMALYKHHMEQERAHLLRQLQAALTNIKTLQGLLPICAACKKIRDDQGYWHQVEEYISHHSDAEFTHGICPDCISIRYADLVRGSQGATPPKPGGNLPPSAQRR
jgi:CheY-like chemotaxis protein